SSLTGAAAIHGQRRLGPVRARASAGMRAGAASISGSPEPSGGALGMRVTGLIATPVVRLDAQMSLSGGLISVFSVESGFYLLGVRGRVAGADASELSGAWLGMQLAVGWSW
ncbi:MAG: hypothetical protein AAGC55_25580, partial [Myxococcota bacterium]